MDLHDFYRMSGDSVRGALVVKFIGDDIGDVYRQLRGEEPPPSELVFRQKLGTRPRDFVPTTHSIRKLISSRVVDLLTEHRFTGWRVYPATIILKQGVVHHDHSLLVITGKCGPIDDSRSPIVTRPPIVEGGSSYRVRLGLHFDLSTWDGSSLFVPENTGRIIVTKAVRDCFIKAKVTNVYFENCTEVEQWPGLGQ